MPASFSGRSLAEVWNFPFDDVAGDFEARVHWCFQQVMGPVRQSWFVLTDDFILADNLDLINRGIDTQGNLDHVQYSTPTENGKVKPWLLKIKALKSWPEPPFLVCTSPVGSAFNHEKAIVYNAPVAGYDVPDQDFESLEAAFAAGYPVTLWGSWNPSPAGSKQANVVAIMPGKILATAMCASMARVRAFALSRQMHYQP